MVFLGEDYTELAMIVKGSQGDKLQGATNNEMKSMTHNEVLEHIELPAKQKAMCCKWIYTTKKDLRQY